MQSNYFISGGSSETMMGPLVAIMLIIATIFILLMPRRSASIALVFAGFIIPSSNVLVVGGMHWMPLRIIALAGIARVLLRGRTEGSVLAGGIRALDRIFIAWAVAHALIVTLQWGTVNALVNQIGFLLTNLGIYFALRHLIRDEGDLRTAIATGVFVMLVNAGGMLLEQTSHYNLISVLGGVPAIPGLREGHVRSQGAFQHTLLAGSFAGAMLPLCLILWQSASTKLVAVAGFVCSTVMVLCTWSSTPLFVFVGAIFGVCMWVFRRYMRAVLWGIVLLILVLQSVMHAPVWFLIHRVEIGGSSGYHRAVLVDNFVRHFDQWWMLGTHANPDWDYEMWDTSNEFVAQGQSGGVLTFACFLALIVRAFQALGGERNEASGQQREWTIWLIGVAVFANLLAFWGVSYWDQIQLLWLLVLAFVPAITSTPPQPAKQFAEAAKPLAATPGTSFPQFARSATPAWRAAKAPAGLHRAR